MNKLIKYAYSIISYHSPLFRNLVLFKSFDGLYNDNPKYISIYLHKISPSTEIIWVASPRHKDAFPEYVKLISPDSIDYIKYSFRAQVLVDNYVGMREFYGGDDYSFWGKIIGKLFARKKRGQLNISTWHGSPLKKIGGDTINSFVTEDFRTSSNMVVSGCEYTRDCLKSAYFNKFESLLFGTPRNDILIQKTDNIIELKNKLGIPLDKKVVLFAPTFRNNKDDSGINQMNDFQIPNMLEILSKKFGGDWCFIFRVHQIVQETIQVSNYASKKDKYMILDGNIHDDMAEYLYCTDLLITDYSGSLFDFALTKRPCFLYAPDVDNYINNDRGMYMDYNSLPFPKAFSVSDLYHEIEIFDYNLYSKKIDQFLLSIGNQEKGDASEKISKIIANFITAV